MASSSRPAPAPEQVLALFGPTASGKTAVAGLLRERLGAEVVSADSPRSTRACRSSPPRRPTRPGSSASCRSTGTSRSASTSGSRTRRSTRSRRRPLVVGGTGLYLRAALSALELPPPPAPGRARALAGGATTGSAPRRRTRCSRERDPAAAARVHANDRRRVVRALELAEAGVVARARDGPSLDGGHPAPDADRRARPAARRARPANRGARRGDGRRTASSRRRGARWAGPLSATARKVLGLEEFATLPRGRGRRGGRRPPRAGSRATSESGCAACPGVVYARRQTGLPEEIADEIVALGRAAGTSTSSLRSRSTPSSCARSVGDADGILEVLDRGDDWLEIAIWNPDGSRAEMSGNGTRIAARWLAEQTGARDRRRARRAARGDRDDARRRARRAGPRRGRRRRAGGGRRRSASRPVDVGNPHAVVDGDPAELPRIGPLLETHARFPQRTNVQVARRAADGDDRGARLGARRGRDRRRRARARSPSPRRSAVTRRRFASRAASCASASRAGGRS